MSTLHETSIADLRAHRTGAGLHRGAGTRRGAVLVLVLIVFSGLSLLAFGLCHRVRLEMRMSQMRGRKRAPFTWPWVG